MPWRFRWRRRQERILVAFSWKAITLLWWWTSLNCFFIYDLIIFVINSFVSFTFSYLIMLLLSSVYWILTGFSTKISTNTTEHQDCGAKKIHIDSPEWDLNPHQILLPNTALPWAPDKRVARTHHAPSVKKEHRMPEYRIATCRVECPIELSGVLCVKEVWWCAQVIGKEWCDVIDRSVLQLKWDGVNNLELWRHFFIILMFLFVNTWRANLRSSGIRPSSSRERVFNITRLHRLRRIFILFYFIFNLW